MIALVVYFQGIEFATNNTGGDISVKKYANETVIIPTAAATGGTSHQQYNISSGSGDSQETDPCQGKEKIKAMLEDANITVDEDLCFRLPTWKSVSNLYGNEPIVYGMETCEAYRALIQQAGSGVLPMPRVGGLYNTGTNALAWTFLDNLERIGEKDLIGQLHPYELPWGKHMEAVYRWNLTVPFDNPESPLYTLPIIVVRDPYRWMQAMCKKEYFVKWKWSSHCPSLVDEKTGAPVPVQVRPPVLLGKSTTYASLADLWSAWNQQYVDATYPRLIIRFEDYLFHGKQVLEQIVQCAGITPRVRNYQYHVEPAKKHGAATDFVTAIIKYGTDRSRSRGYDLADLEYARQKLDPELMRIFQYKHPPK
jgi:hypothetical protein